jgi:hypothetical protein
MLHNYVSIDFYNGSVSCRFNGTSYLFSSSASFLEKTSFPFTETVRRISYEPDRNLYVVEELNGKISSGSNVPCIIWIAEHLANIEQSAKTDATESAAEQSAAIPASAQRQILIYNTDYILQRHQEETLLNISHKLTDQQFANVLAYRQALRDLDVNGYVEGTTKIKTISDVTWPTNPLE